MIEGRLKARRTQPTAHPVIVIHRLKETVMLEIENAVSETLLIPLYIKYLSSQQPDPILYDAAACRLIPQIEYDFSKFDHAYRSIVGTAIRAHYFDNMTADFIRHRKNPVIVELGCGLDSRHERLGNRAGEAPFYLLDLPDVIALREKLLPPRAGETLIAASAFDEEWMDNLLQSHPDAQFLFLIEGVLMYFPKENVRDLFQKLAQRFHGSEILFDVTSTWMTKVSDRHDALKHTRARFAFGCDNDREPELWAANLHMIAAKYLATDFPAWKKTGFFSYWIMRLFPPMRNSYRFLYYRVD